MIAVALTSVVTLGLQAQPQAKPNIVIIWGDDIGLSD
jgi:hypothetical protein